MRIVLLLVLLLGACANQQQASQTLATAKADVAAAEQSLSAAGRLALTCYAVPACNAAAPKVQIRAAFDRAYALVTDAQALVDAGSTPQMQPVRDAIVAVQDLLKPLPK